MPAVARAGKDSIATGHKCSGSAGIATGGSSSKVFVNGEPATVLGTQIKTHSIKVGRKCRPHGASVKAGSSKVSCEGKPISRIGDSADKGSIKSGSNNVFAGG